MKKIYLDYNKNMQLEGNTAYIHLYENSREWHFDIMKKRDREIKYISFGICLRTFI